MRLAPDALRDYIYKCAHTRHRQNKYHVPRYGRNEIKKADAKSDPNSRAPGAGKKIGNGFTRPGFKLFKILTDVAGDIVVDKKVG